jgi:transcriptional regulator with XRE-family HTH domain
MGIAEKITHWRNLRRYSTTKLAKSAGIAQSTLREIELKNTSPSWDTIEKLCSALEISPMELIATNEPLNSKQNYDDKIKNLPEQAKKIIDTVIEVNQPNKEQAAASRK